MPHGFTSTWQTQRSRNGLTFLFWIGEYGRCKSFNKYMWKNYISTNKSHAEDAAVNPSWSCLNSIQELQHPGTFEFMPFFMLWKMERGRLDTTFKTRESKV